MSPEGKFMIYCLERYRLAKSLSGREAAALFAECQVMDYVMRFFESLHVISEKLILKDIEEYIAQRSDLRRSVG